MTENLVGAHIHITGIVQGVGFRPFVYGLATRYSLLGWVRNTSAGVDIEVDGPLDIIQQFFAALRSEKPPLARIDTCEISLRQADGFNTFEINLSTAIEDGFQPISPDVSICPDCINELFDPADRRYLYPFINCTNCGPRFTIIRDIPYDRPNTTMANFQLCQACSSEYHDPSIRRFHAQPVACPACGPHVWLEYTHQTNSISESRSIELPESQLKQNAILLAQRMLLDGNILAIKGLGGYHLACDASNPEALRELRNRKLRIDKPFALMMPDIQIIEKHCRLSSSEADLLLSRQRPIVILNRRDDSTIAREVAPHQNTIGVMLPYTPLHYLLFLDFQNPADISKPLKTNFLPLALVMTSGNLSEEPIATQNPEARTRLSRLADAFLMHNRPIQTRCDDTVMRTFAFPERLAKWSSPDASDETPFSTITLRRSRGYAPDPILLPWAAPPILATGPELKNTFCLTRDRYAFLSQHIGDMENYETLHSFETSIKDYEQIFRIKPELIAYDLHPDYLSTRYAIQRAKSEDIQSLGIQHHHAHIAACMIDNRLTNDKPVIGIAFDGTGYGDDGAIWGSEFLLADYRGYQRFAHLAYMPLPGGDAAIKKPSRLALAYLMASGIEWLPDLDPYKNLSDQERSVLQSQIKHKLNTPLTSSMGRLFDVAAALMGIRQQVNYEAQAAIEMEAMVDSSESGSYSYGYYRHQIPEQKPCPIDIQPILSGIINDLHSCIPISRIAARFHNSIAKMAHEVAIAMRQLYETNRVVLSGGVWQNMILLRLVVELLHEEGFEVFTHHQVPTNDGGLSLGQAAIATQHF
ncbi:MAG: carbamoyltransferase HypF [Anaerolineales bacterium]|nr:MAG: carbamoyltransferase HypF [Anaerolineales bacterium]